MRYDFDRVIDRRNTNSAKWDKNLELFGTDDVLDMWVADMDFPCPEPVLEALRRRLEHPVLGYGFPPPSLYEAIIDRMARLYAWPIRREWITFTPGVVTAVYAAIRAAAEPGDQVVLQPPVYYPFFRSVTENGCQVVNNELRLDEDHYVMDLEDLRAHFSTAGGFPGKTHRIRAAVLCSPHNPVGRVWSPPELSDFAAVCLDHDCVIISDEIHGDLLLHGARHTPTASLSPEIAEKTITLMACSKSFNLAGLEASFVIIPNAHLRSRFERARVGQSGVNILGLAAMEAALRHGDDYLAQLNAYIERNMTFFTGAIAALPGLRPVPAAGPEGTYLAWVDMNELARQLGLVTGSGQVDDAALRRFMIFEARIASDFGYIFGPGGAGFQRFNLACPLSVVEEAVARLAAAIDRRLTVP